MKIIEFMDMKPTKYGGLDKFMVRLMDAMPEDDFYFVFQSHPESEELLLEFGKRNARIVVINTEGKRAILSIISVLVLFLRVRPDVVHFHFSNGFFFYAPIAKLLGVSKIFKTQHCCLTTDDLKQINYKSELSLKTKIASVNGLMYRFFDKIIMCGKYIQNQFRQVYGDSSIYDLIYFGVNEINVLTDSDKAELKKKIGIKDGEVVIMTTAFADPIKGIDILINALPYISVENYVVLLVGLNPSLKLTQNLQLLAQEQGVYDKIKWIGITDNIDQYLSIADIYCQPSRSEALTLAVCEAMSAKLPIVGSNVGGLPEICNLLFEVGNNKELANILSQLINNSELRNKLSLDSYNLYLEYFKIDIGVRQYKNIYTDRQQS